MNVSPTPHEEALAQVDDFIVSHEFTPAERFDIARYYGGDVRGWAVRYLRLTNAADRIRATIGQPAIKI